MRHRGTQGILVIASVTLGRSHSLSYENTFIESDEESMDINTKSAAEAAIVRHIVLVTLCLGHLLAIPKAIPAAVGHMRSHALTQATALLTTGSIAVTVALSQLGTVRPFIVASVGGMWGHTYNVNM